ncbi:MAG: RnfABCDGE type electron transport complex subunit D, partial [Pseudomonadota bacterium]
MSHLRAFFDSIEPHFTAGGKWERYFPVYEMIESILYTPKTVTTAAPHARSYVDMKRIMTYVVLATMPCLFVGLYNVGLQARFYHDCQEMDHACHVMDEMLAPFIP